MIPWPCLHEFLTVITHTRVFNSPSSLEESFRQIEIWKEASNLEFYGEGPRHLIHLQQLMSRGKATGPLAYDARIAAICLEAEVNELWTVDRDFSRFAQLKVVNPLVSES